MDQRADRTLIFTDLDGTLLDHHTYSFSAASEMLDYIKSHHIPLIIVTSKTRPEVEKLQKKLGICDPYIVENGAGIIIPGEDEDRIIPLGKSYDEIRSAFNRYAAQFPMRGFGDMDAKEVAEVTGLSEEEAEDAKARLFTEPFILGSLEGLEALEKLAASDGLQIVKGGRFYHLITRGQDKAAAITRITHYFETKKGMQCITLALGDGENDLSMLGSVDHPVLIPRPDGSFTPCGMKELTKADLPGPAGWNQVLKEYFHVS